MSPARLGLPGGLSRLVRRIGDDARGRRPVLLLDGGSGAGKTGLSRLLVDELDRAGVGEDAFQLVSLDELYTGWDGLASGSAMLPELLDRARPGYRRWDWHRGRPGRRVGLDPAAPLFVEGCGALTPRAAPLATTRLWLAMGAAERKRRALARDGELYAPHWDRWAAQEAIHWRTDRPRELADLELHWLPDSRRH